MFFSTIHVFDINIAIPRYFMCNYCTLSGELSLYIEDPKKVNYSHGQIMLPRGSFLQVNLVGVVSR